MLDDRNMRSVVGVGREMLHRLLAYMAEISNKHGGFARQRPRLGLTIPVIGNVRWAAPSRVVMTRQKLLRSMYWHKHTMVSCCSATSITLKSSSNRFTRLIELVSISRLKKKILCASQRREENRVCEGTFGGCYAHRELEECGPYSHRPMR